MLKFVNSFVLLITDVYLYSDNNNIKTQIMKTIKIQSGNYKVYNNNIFVGTIDKLENNEWVCYDVQGKAFEIAYSKKGALTQYN